MLVDQHLYRKAFQAYLRNGTPIEWSIKQAQPSTYYVWRPREDEKVRPSHAANDGKIFARDNPPPTGNPGDDFGCRCTAERFYPEASEHITRLCCTNGLTVGVPLSPDRLIPRLL